MRLADFLTFNRSDRQVLVVLLVLTAIVLGIVWLGGGSGGRQQEARTRADSLRTDTADTTATAEEQQEPYYQTEPQRQPERFAFDPNTADSTQLLRLGLRPWQVRNIYRYRAKGGIFHRKEDFARLHGLTVREYRELEPYIRISADYRPAAELFSRSEAEEPQRQHDTLPHYTEKIAPGETIDLNTADTTLLKSVPGIGPYYARKIVAYRQRLGGYVSTSQLSEIEDFPTEAEAYLTISDPHPTLLHINRMTVNQLKRHPYINFYQARAMADYRRTTGPITDLQQLAHLRDFPPEAIERLRPYVSYD